MFQQVADLKVVWYIYVWLCRRTLSLFWRFTYVLWQSMFSPQCNHHNPIYQRESLLFSSQTDVQLAEFVRVAALYTWSKKKKNNKNGCSAKVQKRQNTDFLSHQLSWSEPLVTNLMQNKPNWWQFSADHLPFLDLSSDWLHFLSPGKKQMLLVDSFETERLRLRRLRRLTGVWRAPPPWDEKQPWEEGGRLGRH